MVGNGTTLILLALASPRAISLSWWLKTNTPPLTVHHHIPSSLPQSTVSPPFVSTARPPHRESSPPKAAGRQATAALASTILPGPSRRKPAQRTKDENGRQGLAQKGPARGAWTLGFGVSFFPLPALSLFYSLSLSLFLAARTAPLSLAPVGGAAYGGLLKPAGRWES